MTTTTLPLPLTPTSIASSFLSIDFTTKCFKSFVIQNPNFNGCYYSSLSSHSHQRRLANATPKLGNLNRSLGTTVKLLPSHLGVMGSIHGNSLLHKMQGNSACSGPLWGPALPGSAYSGKLHAPGCPVFDW